MRDTTKLVLLGTGTPNADPERSGPSLAVITGGNAYIVDAGPGVVRRAAAAAFRAGVDALAVNILRRLFITHLHSDHTLGYPDLIFTPWVLERTQPLEVYGPTGTREMTEHILAAYREDIRERLYGLEPANREGYRVEVTEIEPGLIYEDAHLCVQAFRVNHGSLRAFGYKFQAPDRTVVISGDTAPFMGYEQAYQDCDVLVHEVYSSAGLKRMPEAWQRYHASVHTSSTQLAEIASRVRPGLLVLYHQLFHGVSEESLLQEVRDNYTGDVVSGKDLEVY